MAWIKRKLSIGKESEQEKSSKDVVISSSIHFKDAPANDRWGSSIPFGDENKSLGKIMKAPSPQPHANEPLNRLPTLDRLASYGQTKKRQYDIELRQKSLASISGRSHDSGENEAGHKNQQQQQQQQQSIPLSEEELRIMGNKAITILSGEQQHADNSIKIQEEEEVMHELHELLWNSDAAPLPVVAASTDETKLLTAQVFALTQQLVQAGIKPNLAPEAGAKSEASRAIEVEVLLMSHARLVRDQNKAIDKLGRQVDDLRGRLEETQGALEDHLLGESEVQAVEKDSSKQEDKCCQNAVESCKQAHQAREKELMDAIAQKDTLIEKLDMALVNYERQLENSKTGVTDELRSSLLHAEEQNSMLRAELLKLGKQTREEAPCDASGWSDTSMSSMVRQRAVPDRNAIMRRIAFRREPPNGSSPAVSVHNVSVGSDPSTDRGVLKALPSINYNVEEAGNGKVQDGSIASVRREIRMSLTQMSKNRSNAYSPGWNYSPVQRRAGLLVTPGVVQFQPTFSPDPGAQGNQSIGSSIQYKADNMLAEGDGQVVL